MLRKWEPASLSTEKDILEASSFSMGLAVDGRIGCGICSGEVTLRRLAQSHTAKRDPCAPRRGITDSGPNAVS